VETQDAQFWRQWVCAELKSGRQVKLKAFGWSMFPTLWPGTQLTISAEPIATLRVNDLLAFESNNRIITHRLCAIVEQKGTWFAQTRGDSCLAPDPLFSESQYLGKVLAIHGSVKHPALSSQKPIAYRRNYLIKSVLIWLSIPFRLLVRIVKRFRFKNQ
jgi:hypothetical protein